MALAPSGAGIGRDSGWTGSWGSKQGGYVWGLGFILIRASIDQYCKVVRAFEKGEIWVCLSLNPKTLNPETLKP